MIDLKFEDPGLAYTEETHIAKHRLGRILFTGLAGASSMIVPNLIDNSAYADSVDDAISAYPDANASCEHYPYNKAGHCRNYDWGPKHTESENDVSELSSRGYAFRNCTDWVAWRANQVSNGAITVPHNLGNGGQWYQNAPPSEKSLTPKAWDAAVSPGYLGHVAFVESVNSIDPNNQLNDNITVSEYNHNGVGTGDRRTGTALSLGFTEFVDFGVHPQSSWSPTSVSSNHRHMYSDFNGDGKDDLVARDGNEDYFDLSHNGGLAEQSSSFGSFSAKVNECDFNGDGKTDLMVHANNIFYIDYDGNGGVADKTISFGRDGDQVYLGDFDGNGHCDILLRRGSTFYLNTSLNNGVPNKAFVFGRDTDVVLVDDFNGDGRDDILLRRGSEDFVDYNADGVADYSGSFGQASDQIRTGDYNGDGKADLILRRGNIWFIGYSSTRALATGAANGSFSYGPDGADVCIGDFDGNGTDDIAVRLQGNMEYFDLAHNGGFGEQNYSFGPSIAYMICHQ